MYVCVLMFCVFWSIIFSLLTQVTLLIFIILQFAIGSLMDDYLGKSCLAGIQCTFISAALLLAKQTKYEILILSNVDVVAVKITDQIVSSLENGWFFLGIWTQNKKNKLSDFTNKTHINIAEFI